MIYLFDKKELKYKQITTKMVWLVLSIIVLFSISVSTLAIRRLNNPKYISQETKAIIIKEHNEFSREKLKEYVMELNIKYPHIVLAQAEIETGGFTSNIFKTQHNLFGMKRATVRPTTCMGEECGHAFYNSWKESVVDYALYAASYLSDIHTEKQYFEYLKQNYAEDPNYISKIKQILSKQELNK